MTISYQRDVASSTAGGFTRLLFKWKGSLYKLIYRELLLFLSAYILLSLIYRQLLTVNQRSLFEMVVKYFDAFLNLIPLSFVLGFYVSYVASRWWQQFLAIPWPDKLFHSVACFVDGFDEEARILRRSLMRYMNLALILVLRSISSAVKQRFPTLEHVVEAGFMTNQEKELFQAVPSNEFNTYWIPCTWFVYRLQEAAKKGKLVNEYALETIMREFCEFRAKCGLLWCYDWVSIPMVYTQVVTLATYVFFIFTVIGRQKIDTLKKGEYMRSGRMPMDIDLYIPVYTILQFFFYMGLLKVAEQLINPFGDDDEDFELNWLVDRHMKASFLGCDILMDPDRIPPMVKDYYWDKQNCPIPYTEASMHFKRKTYKGSADDMIVPENKQHMVLPEIEEEGEDDPHRHSKLSLTSLLLESSNLVTKIGLGDLQGSHSLEHLPASVQTRSLPDGGFPVDDGHGLRAAAAFTPGSWRNGNNINGHNPTAAGSRRPPEILSGSELGKLAPPLGDPSSILRRLSDSNLPGTFGTIDSVSEEDDSDRRGSLAGSSTGTGTGRRGSRLIDLLDKGRTGGGRQQRKRKKDKQGFVWRRMIHDVEDLPRQRTPVLGQSWSHQASLDLSAPPMPPSQRYDETEEMGVDLVPEGSLSNEHGQQQPTVVIRKPSSVQQLRRPVPSSPQQQKQLQAAPSVEEDSGSLNSFKTCPSEPNLSFVPRQISDSYSSPVSSPARSPTHRPGEQPSAGTTPVKTILRANSYAADPPPPPSSCSSHPHPPRSPSGMPLPQLVPEPAVAPPSSIGGPGAAGASGHRQQPSLSSTPSGHIRWKEQ